MLEPAGGTLLGLLATGLVSFLAVRRLARRRDRTARSSLEEQSSPERELEQRIRAIDDPLNAIHFDRALHALEPHLSVSGPPAQLAAVRGVGTSYTFYFDMPVRLPSPFREHPGDGTTWSVDARTLPPTARSSVLYPALVTLGVDGSGATLLLNLEPVGTLRITGSTPNLARGMLTAILLELGTNAWSRDVTVATTGDYGLLAAQVNSTRVRILDTEQELHRLVETEMADRRRAMDVDGFRDVLTDRASLTGDEIRGPHIVITSESARISSQAPRRIGSPAEHGIGLVTIIVDPREPDSDPSPRIEVTAANRALYIGDGQRLEFTPQLISPAVEALLGPLFAGGPNDYTADDAATLATTERTSQLDGSAADAGPRPVGDPTSQAEASSAPYLRLLGPVDALGLPPTAEMPGRTVEFLTYLHTHPEPVASAEVQAALWPDAYDPRRNNVRTLAKQARSALGIAHDGGLLLPEGQRGLGFSMHPSIGSDWDDFRNLIRTDPSSADDEALAAALRLVRGAPLTGANRRRGWWAWRGPLEEKMIATILDVAEELAQRALRRSDRHAVRLAARVAQTVDPLNELGWRIELQLALASDDFDTFDQVLNDIYASLGAHIPGYTLDDATQTIVDQAAFGRRNRERGPS